MSDIYWHQGFVGIVLVQATITSKGDVNISYHGHNGHQFRRVQGFLLLCWVLMSNFGSLDVDLRFSFLVLCAGKGLCMLVSCR